MPGGGPVDAVPPIVIRTEPDTNATQVQTQKLVLEFSEYVERRSVEESIFLSPYLGKLEFDWSGTEVTIRFDERLRENTTYVLNIGTDVVDVRAHNRMASGYTLAFSTGTVIDQGVIAGRVFDEKPEGIMMFAYALNGIHADTLDPSRTRPDFIMQTGRNGVFTLSNLGWGTYRIFAVRDEFRNLIYDKQIDQYGVATGDVTIAEARPRVEHMWFQLSSEDTSKPFVTNVQPVSSRVLHVRFSEPLDSMSFFKSSIIITDTASQQPVKIQSRSLEPADSTLAIVIAATSLDTGKTYRLTIGQAFDRAGNPFDKENSSYSFVGTSLPDTTRPTFTVVGISDSSRGIPLNQAVEIRFNEPVRREPLANAVTLLDSVNNSAASSFQSTSASGGFLIPHQPFNPRAWYTIRVVMDSVKDLSGNGYKDSVRLIRFQSLDLKTTGTMDGVVLDSAAAPNAGEIFLSARKLLSVPLLEETIRLKSPGKFTFEQLPEGQYTLKAFRDSDSSQSYSFGRPFPFRSSEPFAVFPDTIKVRARWGVEGIVIRFRGMNVK